MKVTPGFYLIGLSNVDADKDHNLQLLRERSWFDIPVVYNNNRRAILALEKGTPASASSLRRSRPGSKKGSVAGADPWRPHESSLSGGNDEPAARRPSGRPVGAGEQLGRNFNIAPQTLSLESTPSAKIQLGFVARLVEPKARDA